MHRRTSAFVASLLVLAALSLALAQPAPSDPSFEWADLGRSVYNANCASCHGAEGAGIPGAFPPLAGHAVDLMNPDGGSILLIDTLLYGLQGPIEVDGASYNGAMPGWQQLDDAQVAAVINYIVTSWGNVDALDEDTVLVAPADVAAERDKGLSPADVLALRAEVLGTEAATAPEAGASEVQVLNDEVGYYTEAQADRGADLYAEHCSTCHGDTLRGGAHEPPLTQLGFFRQWNERTFDALYAYYSSTMPFGTSRRLTESQYVAIGAFWLRFHDYPSGDVELTADPEQLRQIIIERR
jgi:mono/diheme cytochrome c family protein